jgi:signal transduction histidine kinase
LKTQESAKIRRELSARLLTALEAERRRIAAELHDGLGQTLTGIKMRVEAALSLLEAGRSADARATLADIVPKIQESIDSVRSASVSLRPSILDDLGIIATIGWFCRDFASSCPGLRIEQDVRVKERDVPPPLKITIYRVLQEAMNNVAKHARADCIRVRLARLGSDIELVVEDNGCGFDVAQMKADGDARRGAGLLNMRQRLDAVGGELSIRSAARIGTTVRAVMPCSAARA